MRPDLCSLQTNSKIASSERPLRGTEECGRKSCPAQLPLWVCRRGATPRVRLAESLLGKAAVVSTDLQSPNTNPATHQAPEHLLCAVPWRRVEG